MKNKLIIAVFIVLLGGLSVVFLVKKNNLKENRDKQMELVRNMSMASKMSTDLKEIEMGLAGYYMSNNNLFPKSLSDLIPQYVAKSDLVKMINDKKILYSYSPDRKKHHIGIDINLPYTDDFSGFKYDKDFDSKSIGYINGFDGKDTIYDLSN